jgi:hypothetical protein
MNTHYPLRAPILGLLSLLVLALLGGCSGGGRGAHASFDSPEAAVSALVAALRGNDRVELARLLGPGSESIVASGDAVEDAADRARFVAAYDRKNALVDGGNGARTLVIGENAWPLPVPLVQVDGRWQFDGAAGVDELAARRIGANELSAIEVARGYVDAQQAYASEGRDGDPAGIYALKLVSDPGMQNGLYWETAPDEPPSPAGPFVAAAAAEGYQAATGGARATYHGYYYRMLYSQGANANGGARDYFVDGLLTGGFALVAWPAEYGRSGVQTFIVNQDGVVFQKDLGPETAKAVEAIRSFDPGDGWVAIVPSP